jgi:hypothetical protein
MRTIRASEIGTYLFCARAWWHQRNGTPSLNESKMKEGTMHHEQHGAKIAVAGFSQRAGIFVLLVAVILVIVGLTLAVLQ